MDFMISTPQSLQAEFWSRQLGRVKKVEGSVFKQQEEWYGKTDPLITAATGKVNFLATTSMMGQFKMEDPSGSGNSPGALKS